MLYRTEVSSAQAQWTELEMTPVPGMPDYYEGTIPGQPAGTTVYYKIWANDTLGNVFETDVFNYTVVDTEAPTIGDISYTPEEPKEGEDVTVKAKVTDVSGVDTVLLLYSTDGGKTWEEVEMTPVGGDYYEATIPGQPAGTEVVFKVWANDTFGNEAVSSEFSYTVKAKPTPAPGPMLAPGRTTYLVIGGAVAAIAVIGVAAFLLRRR